VLTGCAAPPPQRGVELARITWLDAERLLTPEAVVVIPLGAESKEHGPHLELRNDLLLADYFKARVLEQCDVIVAPTLNYHHYPTLDEYPGTTTLRLETARDLTVDVVKSIAKFGPKRFYVLNTGVSTVRALRPAKEELAREGIEMRFTDLKCLETVTKEVCTQVRGSHADEIETSMMLVIAPETVDMSKAVNEANVRGEGGLGRDPDTKKTYSKSGVWGDATLATRAKGERICDFLTGVIVRDIEDLRAAKLP
jgi:creatinine amidohydrolase